MARTLPLGRRGRVINVAPRIYITVQLLRIG